MGAEPPQNLEQSQPSGAVCMVIMAVAKRVVSALADTVPFFGIADFNHVDKVVKREREHKERNGVEW